MATTIAVATPKDDTLTLCAISVVAAMIADVLHEAVGHAALALLSGAQSGVLSTVSCVSTFESRLVAAGGTLVNLIAGVLSGGRCTRPKRVREHALFPPHEPRLQPLRRHRIFFFSGVTNFGDWARVIAQLHPYWLWRTGLVLVGVASYYGAVLLVGISYARHFGIAMDDPRLRRLTIIPYISAIALIGVSGLFNPMGINLVWQSALPATAGAYCGLLWFRYYVPNRTTVERPAGPVGRNYAWVSVAIVLAIAFIVVLGRGITISLQK